MEAALLSWFDEHGRDLPWRRTRDPYAILVSEVMLQQTQVDRVVPRYRAWLVLWPTANALANPALRARSVSSTDYPANSRVPVISAMLKASPPVGRPARGAEGDDRTTGRRR